MNRPESAQLLAYLNRAGVVMAVEGQAAVWADALDDVDFGDAQEAARRIVRDRTGAERWVTPGDVRRGVRDIRRARLETALAPLPSADPDNVREYLAETRALRAQIASGQINPNQIGARA